MRLGGVIDSRKFIGDFNGIFLTNLYNNHRVIYTDIYVITNTVDLYWKLFRHHGVSIVTQQIKNLLFC